MSRDTFYTAIDIGTGKIASIVARVGTEGELKILGSGVVLSQGVQKGRIESIDEVQTAIRASLDESQKYIARGVIDGVYVSVSGTHLSCLNTKEAIDNPEDFSDVSRQLLHQLIQSSFPRVDRSQEILHVIPIAYDVDGLSGVRNPIGLHAEQVQVEAHVVLGDAATLRNTIKAVEACKVTVKSLVLQSLASAEATLTGDERELGAVLADIGSGTTDVIIYRQGSPWYSAVIPVGGNQLTRDLSVAIRTSFYLAEEIKIKWGHALPELVREDEEIAIPSFQGQPRRVVRRRDLGEPLQARYEELLKLIVLKVRQAGLRQIPAGGLIITGGSAELPGVRELAQKILGGPVRIAYPRGIPGLPTQLKKPAFSASVGLLLWGIKHLGEKRPYLNGERTLRAHKPLFWRFKRVPEAFRKVKVGHPG